MRVEDIECKCGDGQIVGRGVLLIPILGLNERDDTVYGDPAFLHQTCFIEVFDSVFIQENTTHFEIYIGSVFDLWAGMFTGSDEEAGITEH